MVQILILTHGSLAQSLLETSRTIVGELDHIEALSLDWDALSEALEARLLNKIASIDTGDGVLILTDLYGDTPSNLAASLLSPGRVDMVCGVNLPMVLRLGCPGLRELPLSELAQRILDKGREAIRMAEPLAAPEEVTS